MNCLNRYQTNLQNTFSTIGHKYANKITKSSNNFEFYLGKSQRNSKTLYMFPTDVFEIRKILTNLPNKKSSGWDGISNITLKYLTEVLEGPLCVAINKSMKEGKFPNILKSAIVVPLYKSKERYLLTNYRPISLVLTISKVFEKIIHHRISRFLEQSNMFYDGQYGFRQNRNTVSAVSDLVGKILENTEQKKVTGLLLLDLSKAFDTISKRVLLAKLEYYGVRGISLNLTDSYLSSRNLRANVNGELSDEHVIDIGTPQGSILGPLYFSVIINDLIFSLNHTCDAILYADDTTLICSGRNLQEVMQNLQQNLTYIVEYYSANSLSINVWENRINNIQLKKCRHTKCEAKIHGPFNKPITCM